MMGLLDALTALVGCQVAAVEQKKCESGNRTEKCRSMSLVLFK